MDRRGLLALAGVLALIASPAQATLIVGFQFTGGGTSVVVPATGGIYTVDIFLSSDVAGLTDLRPQAGYVGGLSAILNSNLANATLTGNVTANAVLASWNTVGLGDIQDNNGDSRNDFGNIDGVSKLQSNGTTGGGGAHPWWFRASSGGSAASVGGTSGAIGTFTVTIPAYTPNANSGSFLSYTPQLDPSGAGNDWSWDEVVGGTTTSRGGNFSVTTGVSNVNAGTSVTFSAVPEPATFVLLGVGGLGLMACRRWRRR